VNQHPKLKAGDVVAKESWTI